jgi:hypothetical protein
VYASGSGTNVLSFTYIISAGEATSRLDAASATALDIFNGAITNSDGDPAALTVPISSAAGSLASNANLVIDAVAPIVLSYQALYGAGRSYELIGANRDLLPWAITGVRVQFSKPIVSGSAASLSGLSATGISGVGTTTLTWNIAAVTQGAFATKLPGAGTAGLRDAAGNLLQNGYGHSQWLIVLYGDYNGDGVVSSADMAGVRAATIGGYDLFADLNGDGRVDADDVAIARNRTGARLCPSRRGSVPFRIESSPCSHNDSEEALHD